MHRTCGTTDVINLFKVPMTFVFVYVKTHNVSIWIDMAHIQTGNRFYVPIRGYLKLLHRLNLLQVISF